MIVDRFLGPRIFSELSIAALKPIVSAAPAIAPMTNTVGTNKKLLRRREFNRFCAVLGLSLPSVSAMLASVAAPAAAGSADLKREARRVTFRDGTVVSALGQGTWHLGNRHPETIEEEALRTGISLGMTVIDTAELYSGGHSEELVGAVIAGRRDQVFLGSKVTPNHVTDDGRRVRAKRALAFRHRSSGSLSAALAEPTLISQRLWPGSRACARGVKFVPGECPTLK